MAAKHSNYSKWGLAAIGGGVALSAIEVIGAVGYLISQWRRAMPKGAMM
jgi:hypothetical protein